MRLEGNLCRATGYQHVVNALRSAAKAGCGINGVQRWGGDNNDHQD